MEPLSVCAEPARVIDPWGLSKCSVNGANAYSPAYEIKLAKTAYPGGGRGQHFQEANESLLKPMENGSAFAEPLNKLGIKPERTPTGIASRRLPEGDMAP